MVTLDPGSPLRSDPSYAWDYCGGHLALDFTNTVGDRGARPVEHFDTFGDIVAWAEARGVISKQDAGALRQQAAANPDAARRAWRSAVTLREAVYAVLAAASAKRKAKPADLDIVNGAVRQIFQRATLAPAGDRFMLETHADRGLDLVLAPVVRATVDLLTSDALSHVGRCADDECQWLFLDTTRSRTRRWCDMKSCGNRHKVRRFRRSSA
jgi:predicted RNA-binding Zn ribbon-like protein